MASFSRVVDYNWNTRMSNLPSPYLLSHPEMNLLVRGVDPFVSFQEREFYRLLFFIDGVLVRQTVRLPLNRVRYDNGFFRLRPGQKLETKFSFESWHHGNPTVVDILINLKRKHLPKAGGVSLDFAGLPRIIPSIVRNARTRVGQIRKKLASGRKRLSLPRSSSLRANPEIAIQAYARVTEAIQPPNGYSLQSTFGTYPRFHREWTGVRTPGFSKLRPALRPVNASSAVILENSDVGAFLNFIPSTGISANVYGLYTEYYPAPPGFLNHLDGATFKALRKLIENANANIDANLAQDLAQYSQTVNLITNTVKRLTKSVTALRKKNIPKAIRELWHGHTPKMNGKGPSINKSLADNWLELQYGWKPLLQDIDGAMKALAILQTTSPFVRRVTGVGNLESVTVDPIPHRLHTGTLAGYASRHIQTRASYMIRYCIATPLTNFLAQTGFTNPVNLLWEILPFSFVVDWFTPIGPFLETLSSWDGLVFHSGSLTVFTRVSEISTISFFGGVPTAPGQLFEEHAKFSRLTTHFDRQKLFEFPSASMPSGFKNGLASIVHAENALALLQKAFK